MVVVTPCTVRQMRSENFFCSVAFVVKFETVERCDPPIKLETVDRRNFGNSGVENKECKRREKLIVGFYDSNPD